MFKLPFWPILASSFTSDMDLSLLTEVMSPTIGASAPRHRSPGGRAHRRWRKTRSAGRR